MPPPASVACGRSLYSRAAGAVLRLGNRAFAAHARWYTLTLGLAAVFVVGAVSRHILAQNGSGEGYKYSYLPYLPYIGQRLGEDSRGSLQFRSFPTEPAELKEMMQTLNHVCRETDEVEQPVVQVRPQLYQCAPCLLVPHIPLQTHTACCTLLGAAQGLVEQQPPISPVPLRAQSEQSVRCGRVQPQEHLLAGMLQGDCTYRGLLQHCLSAPVCSTCWAVVCAAKLMRWRSTYCAARLCCSQAPATCLPQ